MSSYGLKTNIAVNIAVLVFFGMLLTAFLTTNLFQRILVHSEVEKGFYIISAIEEYIAVVDTKEQQNKAADLNYGLRKMLINSGVESSVLVYPDLNKSFEFCKSVENTAHMKKLAGEAFDIDTPYVTMAAKGWGVFWKHNTRLMISAPVYIKNEKLAGICLVIPLNKMFLKIRNVLNIVFLYVLVNALVLTIVGVYQISKSAVKPVHRLLKKANDYQADNGSALFEEKSENEFKQLSSALNNMLGRISDDRGKLKDTVVSLEIANAELKKAQKDIVRAEKLASVGRLSSGIAHEIGNPLGIVGGYLELIKDEKMSTEQKRDFIERAEKEIARIDRIIRQLLDYSRHSKENMAELSVDEIIADVAEMLKIQPFMANIRLDFIPESKNALVKADADQLRQVFLNLAINAADAINSVEAKNNGRIIIRTEIIEENTVKISCEDNGSGISSENIANVFDPFYTTKEPGKGTGLGLSVCFMIIEGFDGKLSIESEEGVRTIVGINLPAIQS